MSAPVAPEVEEAEVPQGTNFRRGFGWNFAFNVFTKSATPLIFVIVARRLGPEVMGTYWIVTTVMIFTDIFRDSVFTRVYLREPKVTETLDHGYGMLSVVGHAILALLVAAMAVPMSTFFHQDVLLGGLLIAALAVLVNGFSALPYTRLLRAGQFKQAGFAEAMGSVGSSLVALVWVLQGGGFWALVAMAPIRSVIFLALTYARSPYRLKRGESGFTRRILGASSLLTATNVMWVGFSFGDQLLVSRIFGVAAGGAYGAGKMMVQTADVLAKPITQTATIAFAERKSDRERVRQTLYKSLLTFLIAIAPVYAAVAAFSRPLVLGLLSERFAGTVAVLPALCLYFAIIYPGSFAADSLVMAKRERIPFLAWLTGYIYLGVALAVCWGRVELPTLAWILTSGLVLVNAATLTVAVLHYPAGPETSRNVVRSLGAFAATSVVAFGIAGLPIADLARVGMGLLLVPMAHLAALGTIFNQNPLSMMKLSGVKALWRRL